MKNTTLIFSILLGLPATGVFAHGRVPPPSRDVSQSTKAGSLPMALRPVLYRSLSKDAGAAYAVDAFGCAVVPGQPLKGCFTGDGARIGGGHTEPLTLRLVAWGRNHDMHGVRPVAPAIRGNRVTYSHGALTEWWKVMPLGLEQGFTLSRRPGGQGPLVLELATNGAAAVRGDDTLCWGKLRYGRLVVTDADGRIVPAELMARRRRVSINIQDAHARYPLTVDPLVWIAQEAQASDSDSSWHFGWSVSIDGTTAVISAPGATVDGMETAGAAYIFNKTAGTWSETQRITASDASAFDAFGWGVAISGDTIIIGAPPEPIKNQPGAAYVFSKIDGVWTQTQKISGSDTYTDDRFGEAVAIDGTTAVVGARWHTIFQDGAVEEGAVYVFDKSGGSWSQTQKLLASDEGGTDYFGNSLAIEGDTILVGAPGANVDGNIYQGAAYLFVRSGGAWTQEQKLTASDGMALDQFGSSVALYGDSALIGAPLSTLGDNSSAGAAYGFNDVDGFWTQGQKLTALNGGSSDDYFGTAVALSDAMAVVAASFTTIDSYGPQGAAFIFSKSDGVWSQTQRLIASEGAPYDHFGASVSIDGHGVVVGAEGANATKGLAYFYGASDLDLTVSAPTTATQNSNFTSQAMTTNSSSVASPAIAVTVAVPATASFISASATQGSCSETAGVVTCDLGSLPGNGGSASANVTLKAIGAAGDTIWNTASIAHATPALTASAPTQIVSPYEAYIQPPVGSGGSSVFNAHRGALPIKFTLTMNGSPTCSLPPATIAVERTDGSPLGEVGPADYEMPSDHGVNFRVDTTDCQYIYILWARGLGPGTYRVSISVDGTEVGSATFTLGTNSSNGSSSNGHAHATQGDPPAGAAGAGSVAPLWLGLLAVLIAFTALRRRHGPVRE